MKYVILRDRFGMEVPFSCTVPASHADLADGLKPLGYTPVSAGFYVFLPDGTVRTFGASDSLNLKPRPGDEAIITAFYRATLQSAAAFPV